MPSIAQVSPTYVVLAHTYQARDFVPMLAARIDRALVTDVIAIKGTGEAATFARPMFQGKLVADVALQGPQPHLVTVLRLLYGRDPGFRLEPCGIAATSRTGTLHLSSRTPTVSSFGRCGTGSPRPPERSAPINSRSSWSLS